jgi:capsid assembly protease
MNNAASWILSHRWAILPEMLKAIVAIANREATLTELKEAIATKDAQPLPGARRAEIRDGIAIIPVLGPIFPRANLFTMISGATSIQTLAKDFTVALEDPNVSGIILNIDSPGGEITGVNEFADMVKAGRSVKPITAYVYGWGASAAYWIASAAGRIVADATAEVGSIGVVAAYTDERERDQKSGVKTIEIVSSVSPFKRLDPATDAGRAQIQKTVDELAVIFVSAVAQNRNVSTDKVLSDFGKGDTLVGKSAMNAGMIDMVGSFESTVTEMKDKVRQIKQLYMGGF